MATKRIKDLTNTATSVASDSYLAIDGTSNGTEKITRDNFRQDTADAFVAAPGTYNLAPLSGGAVEVAKGGTGSTTAAGARTNLSVNSIDEDAQANALKVTAPALYFDGSNDYIEVADDDKFSFTDGTDDLPFSISAWVLIEDSTNFTVVGKWSSGSNREWILWGNASDQLQFYVRDSGTTAIDIRTSAITAYEGQWIHLAACYGGSGPNSAKAFSNAMDAGNAEIYINGVLQTVTRTNSGSYTGMANTSQAVEIARITSLYSKGSIRGVKIFNRELTASEVAELARGNDLGFSEEWAGALGAAYTSDFSAGVDGWVAFSSTGTVAGNVDGIGGEDDTLRFTLNTNAGVHAASISSVTTVGKRYRVAASVYVPSTNSNVDGLSIRSGGGSTAEFVNLDSITQDAWQNVSGELVAVDDEIRIYTKEGASSSQTDAGGDDVFYIKNVKITEIGTLADFRAENYDPDSLTLADISDNAFIGTNNGATFVGNGLPPHAATRQQLAETNALKTTAPALHLSGTGEILIADADIWTFSDTNDLNDTLGTWSPDDNTPALTDGTGTLNDHYRVDANAGTVAQGGSTLSIIDGVATSIGQVVYYDGSVWRLRNANDLPVSIAMWVKAADLTSLPLCVKAAGGTSKEFVLRTNSSDKLQYISYGYSLQTANITADNALTAYEGQWVHVCLTYGGSGNDSATAFASAADAMALYVNGSAVAATGTTGDYIGLSGTTQGVSIGRDRAAGSYATADYRGVKIFNRELTASEVAELARGNDLGFSEEWAGANGGVYTQDATPSGEWGSVRGADADEAGPITGRSNVLKYTADNTNGTHYALLSSSLTLGKRYRLDFDVNIPSQSNIDGIEAWGGEFLGNTIPSASTWTNYSVEFVASSTELRLYATDGAVLTFTDAGGDDVFYIDGLTLTEIGTLADFRAERYDTSTNKLYDISDNAFVGTGTSVSLTGREVPVYEHGTWTPTLTFGGGSTGVTYGQQQGNYTRIGRIVYVSGYFVLTSKGTDTGSAKINGLPFTAVNLGSQTESFVINRTANMASLTSAITGNVDDNASTFALYDHGAAGSTTVDDTNFTNTSAIRFSGTYQIQ